MTDSLIPYNQNLPEEIAETIEEAFSRQFYEWEKRGRGWRVHDFPVELEPPFRPFSFFLPEQGPIKDDGHIPTFFSELFNGSPGLTDSSLTTSRLSADLLSEHEEYLAEADEPEVCSYYHDEFSEIQLLLPPDLKLTRPVIQQFVMSQAYSAHPISFEVIGTAEKVVVQFAAAKKDFLQLRQQLDAHIPRSSFPTSRDHQGLLASHWLNSGNRTVIADFGLSNEFFVPLNMRGDIDPLVTIVGALSNLKEGEIGIFQVLFKKAKHPWSQEITRLIQEFEGSGLFDHIPAINSLTKQKLTSPMYAVVVRAAARSIYNEEDAWGILRNIGAGLAFLANPASNELIPLSNDGYDDDDLQRSLLNRQSCRSGMLLNTEELVSLVCPPSPAVRSKKLIRESERTKLIPDLAKGNSLVLGENRHNGEINTATLSDEQRSRHVHIIGSSGSGKSNLLLSLIKQDMNAGNGICAIDPHGDLIDDIVANVPESRLSDVILFDPADSEYPIGFNILQAKSELEKTILSSDLVATFRKLSTSWGDVMDAVLANAILAFIESGRGGTLLELKRFLVEKPFRDEFLESVTDDAIRYFWHNEFPVIAGKPQASILIRLDSFLRQKLIRNIVCQKESNLDFRVIMDSQKIFLIKLSQGLIGEENAYLLGSLLVSKLYQTAMSRQDTEVRPYFWLYLDEFQHFITPSMEGILSGTRKYHLGLTLAHQEFRQMQSRNQEVASSVLSNCYTRICFRLGDSDAEKLAAGFSFFDAKALQNLGVGEALGRIERAEYDFNLKTSVLPSVPLDVRENKKAEILANTRGKFSRLRSEVEHELRISSPMTPTQASTEKSLAPEAGVPEDPVADKHKPVRDVPVARSSEAPAEMGGSPAGNVRSTSTQPESKQRSQQHQYLQSLVKRMAENHGFRVTIEKEVFGGVGKIDLALENETRKIACEISVTNEPDYELLNIRKCISAGYETVIMISANIGHLEKIRQKAMKNLTQEQVELTHFLMPEEFFAWLDNLGADKSDDRETVKGFKVKVHVKPANEAERSTRKRAISDVVFGALKRLKNNDREK